MESYPQPADPPVENSRIAPDEPPAPATAHQTVVSIDAATPFEAILLRKAPTDNSPPPTVPPAPPAKKDYWREVTESGALAELTRSAQVVLANLATNIDYSVPFGAEGFRHVRVGRSTIKRETGMSRTTVTNALRALEERAFIKRLEKADPRRAMKYALLSPKAPSGLGQFLFGGAGDLGQKKARALYGRKCQQIHLKNSWDIIRKDN